MCLGTEDSIYDCLDKAEPVTEEYICDADAQGNIPKGNSQWWEMSFDFFIIKNKILEYIVSLLKNL